MTKAIHTLFILTIFTISFGLSQTAVEPGSGTLVQAILAAGPGDILVLTSGGEYIEPDSANLGLIDKELTIKVADDATEKAVVKYADTTSNNNYYFIMQNGGSLTLKGIEFSGMVGDLAQAKSLLYWSGGDDPASAVAGTIRIEDCIIHDFSDNIFHGFKKAEKGMIQDSIFIDNTVAYNAGKAFLRMKYISLRYLSITNSTFYDLASYGIFMGAEADRATEISPVAVIDHCTFNNMAPFVEVLEMSNPWSITNSIFSNTSNEQTIGLNWADPKIDTVATITNSCLWNFGHEISDTSSWPGFVIQDTISVDPLYVDAENGDFTLPDGSALLTYATDGAAIGDPQWAGDVTALRIEKAMPVEFSLLQNYPNPFNPATKIEFSITKKTDVQLIVYDISGAVVALLVNESLSSGSYSVEWDASNMASGIYFYRLNVGGQSFIKKMTLLK